MHKDSVTSSPLFAIGSRMQVYHFLSLTTTFKEIIACVESHNTIPSHYSAWIEVKEICKSTEISIKDSLKDVPGIVRLTTDARSSRVYKVYLSIMMHWIDKTWCLRHVFLHFVRFPTAHNAETTSTLLFELLSSWNSLQKSRWSLRITHLKCAHQWQY